MRETIDSKQEVIQKLSKQTRFSNEELIVGYGGNRIIETIYFQIL